MGVQSDRSGRVLGAAILTVAIVGFALSYSIFLLFQMVHETTERRHFDQHARQLAASIGQVLQSQLLLVNHLRGELTSAEQTEPDRFRRLVTHESQLFPGLRAFMWLPSITPARLAAFVDGARRQGPPRFSVFDGRGPIEASRPPEGRPLFPLRFVEPSHGNEHLLGHDFGGRPDWLAAMEKARDTGVTTVVPRAGLGEARRTQLVFLAPVYDGAAADDRRDLFRGILGVMVETAPLLQRALFQGAPGLFALKVTIPGPDGEVEIFRSPSGAFPESVLKAEHLLHLTDPPWRIAIAASSLSATEQQRNLEWGVLLAGALATLSLAGMLAASFTRTRRVEDLMGAVTVTNEALRQEVMARTIAEEMQNRLNMRLLQEMREREQAEVALRRSEHMFRQALAPTGVVVFAADTALRLTWDYNWSLPVDMVGKTAAEVFSARDAELLTRLMRHVIDTGAGLRETVQMDVAGGTDFDLTLEPLLDGGGNLVGVTGTAVDVTALNRARAEAERANAAKSRFLAAASHDLRQPLVALRLFLELLAETLTTEEQKGYAARVCDSLGATETLLNVLMDISALEAGKIVPQVRTLSLDDLVDRIADECQAEALGKEIALRTRHSRRQGCPSIVRTDPVLLERILRNLVSNALRYTPGGQVLIACRRRGDGAAVEVWDTGVGIPEDKLERIFDDFYQIPHDTLGGGIGLGLGLSTVARMARLLGCRVEVKSRHGAGSMFRIVIPGDAGMAMAPRALPPPPAVNELAGRVVAVVEDDPSQLVPLATRLRKWGCRVFAAPSGAALEEALAEAGCVPELILADHWLGEETGFEVLARLRSRADHGIPALVLTGDTDSAIAAQVAAAGCGLIRKPFTSGDLRSAVEKALAGC